MHLTNDTLDIKSDKRQKWIYSSHEDGKGSILDAFSHEDGKGSRQMYNEK